MKLNPLTSTHFERHLSAVYAVKEIISLQKIDEHKFMVDTLMTAYYGLEDILEDIQQIQREEFIKRMAKMQKEQQ